MPYKISGTLYDAARIIVIKESDWSIESNTEESSGAYEVDGLESGYKWVLARKSDGEVLGYGYITPIEYISPGRGVFGGGEETGSVVTNVIDYVTISTLGNATDFGDIGTAQAYHAATSNGTNDRGIFGGGYNAEWSIINTISYITISVLGNTTDFGDLSSGRHSLAAISNGSNNRGTFGGGFNSDIIDYVTISSIGNATDFGNLTQTRTQLTAASNSTNNRGVFAGGYYGGNLNIIDYITISSVGNATDFGDLTVERTAMFGGTSNGTNNRGVFGGGMQLGTPDVYLNVIDYITISSTGDATDFGDLTTNRYYLTATSNRTAERGVFAGGYDSDYTNVIEYITINSASNATDFGDLLSARSGLAATSNA